MLLRILTLISCVTLLAACGGGGGGGGSTGSGGGTQFSSGSSAASSTSTSSAASSSASSAIASNAVAITVSKALGAVNEPYVSVTICVPGTSTCRTIDNVLVDTGSSGLRIMASALDNSFITQLPAKTTGSNSLGECMLFGSGYAWGSVKTADFYIASETASSLPIQIMGDGNSPFSTVPSTCSSTGTSLGSVSALGANGILGLSPAQQDCGSACALSSSGSVYYSCTSSSCTQTTLASAQQVPQPVTKFSADNNGVVIVMPAVGASGASATSGVLYFGIGTQSNNVPGSVTAYGTASNGDFAKAVINGSTYTTAFLDSGSNGFFFPYSMTVCTDSLVWYCPTATTSITATITSVSTGSLSSQSTSLSFSIANADNLFATGNSVFNNLGAKTSSVVDFGFPFFLGRSVFVAVNGQSTSIGSGPYVAF